MHADLVSGVPRAASVVNFANETTIAFIGGVVIVAVMFLAVSVGGANAGDCTRSQSADAPAAEAITRRTINGDRRHRGAYLWRSSGHPYLRLGLR